MEVMLPSRVVVPAQAGRLTTETQMNGGRFAEGYDFLSEDKMRMQSIYSPSIENIVRRASSKYSGRVSAVEVDSVRGNDAVNYETVRLPAVLRTRSTITYRICGRLNPKHEVRNPKQNPSTNVESTLLQRGPLGTFEFLFWDLFRASWFGFRI